MVAPVPTVTREHLYLAAAYRRRQMATAHARRIEIERDWRTWLIATFPAYVDKPFADYHADFWDWVWSIEPGIRSRPFVAIWPRSGGKSTSVELACAMLAATGKRAYVLYVSGSQGQANKHVGNVATLLESPAFAAIYPDAARRSVNKYNQSKGWRQDRLRTASGFTLDAVGLDVGIRGTKADDERPDLIVFDDIDEKLDTPATTEKHETVLTHSVLPAAGDACTVLAVQNLVIEDGVFARLASTDPERRADFLADRIVSGPHPAIRNLVTEQTDDGRTRIVSGEPTWGAMDLAVCQTLMDTEGETAFRAERQHEVDVPAGGMFDRLTFRRCAWVEVPDLVDVVVAVDPAVTDTDRSDSYAIHADGVAADGDRQSATLYRLYSWEDRTNPEDAMRRALRKAVELGASTVVVETNQGGDTWRSVYDQAWNALVADPAVPAITTITRTPRYEEVKAPSTTTKVSRAEHMLTDYERGQAVHVIGTHETLERALKRFPKTKPFDLVDAAGWSRKHLRSDTFAGLL